MSAPATQSVPSVDERLKRLEATVTVYGLVFLGIAGLCISFMCVSWTMDKKLETLATAVHIIIQHSERVAKFDPRELSLVFYPLNAVEDIVSPVFNVSDNETFSRSILPSSVPLQIPKADELSDSAVKEIPL